MRHGQLPNCRQHVDTRRNERGLHDNSCDDSASRWQVSLAGRDSAAAESMTSSPQPHARSIATSHLEALRPAGLQKLSPLHEAASLPQGRVFACSEARPPVSRKNTTLVSLGAATRRSRWQAAAVVRTTWLRQRIALENGDEERRGSTRVYSKAAARERMSSFAHTGCLRHNKDEILPTHTPLAPAFRDSYTALLSFLIFFFLFLLSFLLHTDLERRDRQKRWAESTIWVSCES